MVTKPLRGDPWINGAFDDGKDFEELANFLMVFQVFPQNSVSVPFSSTDNGTSKLIDLLVKISSYKISSLIFFVHQRGVWWYIAWTQPETHLHGN